MKDEGLKILLKAFWCNNGWNNGVVSDDEFKKAKEQGYMFDYPKYCSHQEHLKRINDIVDKINPEDVANAFLYSLSTRKLEYRSILGSYYYAKCIPQHRLDTGYSRGKGHCYLCGWYAWEKEPDDYELHHGLNYYNFRRYKWGGSYHTLGNYALFDMEQFLKLPKVIPTKQDKEIFVKILKCIDELEGSNKAGKLRDKIIKEKIFKTNRDEVSSLLDILGICGVLCPRNMSYEENFVDEYERGPLEHTNDFAYPLNRWHVYDGVNKERFENVFFYEYK